MDKKTSGKDEIIGEAIFNEENGRKVFEVSYRRNERGDFIKLVELKGNMRLGSVILPIDVAERVGEWMATGCYRT